MTSADAAAVLAHARKDIRSIADDLIRLATVANAQGDQAQRDAYVTQAETLIRFAADTRLERFGAYAVTAVSQYPADDKG